MVALADDPTPLLTPASSPLLPCVVAHPAPPGLQKRLIAVAALVAARQKQDGEVLVDEGLARAHEDKTLEVEAGVAVLAGHDQGVGLSGVMAQNREEAAALAVQTKGSVEAKAQNQEQAARLTAQAEGRNGDDTALERGFVLNLCQNLGRSVPSLKTAYYQFLNLAIQPESLSRRLPRWHSIPALKGSLMTVGAVFAPPYTLLM
ncbi:hypothetical protein Emag_000513 [Eimeria magna]